MIRQAVIEHLHQNIQFLRSEEHTSELQSPTQESRMPSSA